MAPRKWNDLPRTEQRRKLNALRRGAYRTEFADLGEFLAAVVHHDLNEGAFADPRIELQAVATGAGEALPSTGGLLVPEDFAADLWQRTVDTGQLLARCDRIPIAGFDGIHIPAIDETSRADGSRFGGARSYWVDEADAATATQPAFRSMLLKPKKLLTLTYVTGELAADAPALAAWLRRIFGLEASFRVEDDLVNGNGAGKPLGILNSGALITVDAEEAQAAGTVQPANLSNMAKRLWGPSHRTAVWLFSNDVFDELANASFANGAPVIDRGRILNMPYALSEYTPAIGQAGDVVLADFGQYLIGEKAPDFLSSLHVRFVQDELAFKFRWRIDGQPAWRSAVTPNNSATTQSPFVALAAR